MWWKRGEIEEKKWGFGEDRFGIKGNGRLFLKIARVKKNLFDLLLFIASKSYLFCPKTSFSSLKLFISLENHANTIRNMIFL